MTIFQLQKQIESSLSCDERVAEALQIIKHILNTDTTGLVKVRGDEATDEQIETAEKIVAKRNLGTPLYYILGRSEFYSLEFLVGEGVLIPRADTEVLVDTALEVLRGVENPKVLDLCAGSGAIAVAIAKNRPDARVDAVEYYETAFEYLKKNVALNDATNVTAILADALEFFGEYDLVVSNPPYIAESEKKDLAKEVLCEPSTALFAEHDGYLFYEKISQNFKTAQNFTLLFEIGYRQSQKVCEILSAFGYKQIEKIPDLNGITRVIKAEK